LTKKSKLWTNNLTNNLNFEKYLNLDFCCQFKFHLSLNYGKKSKLSQKFFCVKIQIFCAILDFFKFRLFVRILTQKNLNFWEKINILKIRKKIQNIRIFSQVNCQVKTIIVKYLATNHFGGKNRKLFFNIWQDVGSKIIYKKSVEKTLILELIFWNLIFSENAKFYRQTKNTHLLKYSISIYQK